MKSPSAADCLPEPLIVSGRELGLDALLGREWLRSNERGAYAGSTAAGCNTRRYHGLLIAAQSPPMGRWATLSTVMEQLFLDGQTCELACNEFVGAFAPRGFEHLAEYRDDVAATYVYRVGGVELLKEILLAESDNAVAVRYTLRGGSAELALWPFAALRDFHHLRRVSEPHQVTFSREGEDVRVEDRQSQGPSLHLRCPGGRFDARAQWWYRFCYRGDLARGQEGSEDLYTPGPFHVSLEDGASCQLTASFGEPALIDFEETLRRRRRRLAERAAAVGDSDETTRRLAAAGESFVVERHFTGRPPGRTILAGFPWFADWGRDTFIALPGILLETGRLDEAERVFETYCDYIEEGMVPNRFDDYAPLAHYNSIDASLQFCLAAERYLAAGGQKRFWKNVLLPAMETILRRYREGTRFDIRADADGLLAGGSIRTQLTWMDAALGEEVVTPRHGKAVEVNALWYFAHRCLAERLAADVPASAAHYAELADQIGESFRRAFWYEQGGHLYDCITDGTGDASLRPNQIFAVSLPHSPLQPHRQRAVVDACRRDLLTPYGLRTLSPHDPRYRRRYGNSWESRDRSYHQGTVWAWLMGPFIEAYMKVNGGGRDAVEQARRWLAAFEGHLREAGLGSVSEIFDGDAPHAPRGCYAQAWSVGEVLRARRLVDRAAAAE